MSSHIENKTFSFSSLWSNKDSRAVIVQIITMSVLIAIFAYAISNVVNNLAIVGKEFGFSFLNQRAGYDINQTLIDYSSDSTHLRAMFVGILNTLLVAVLGIILATIIGFSLGVMRLSKNLLINKLSYFYVEYMRNVPVLIHILLVHGIVINSFPSPKNAIEIPGIEALLSNRGLFVPKPSMEPLFWVVIAIFVAGIIFSVWFKRFAKKTQDSTGKQYPVLWIILGAIIGAPLLAFFVLGMPLIWDAPYLKGFGIRGGIPIKPELLALWLALSLYTASFIAEIVRAGIMAVSHGQTEASLALGLSKKRTTNLIIIPQALRTIIPPLTSQYLNLTKNSSLAIAISYMDIVATIGGITLNQTGREMECMFIVLCLYLAMSLLISMFMNWYNKRIKLVER